MSDPEALNSDAPKPASELPPEGAEEAEFLHLDTALTARILTALAKDKTKRVRKLCLKLHASDLADLFERVNAEERQSIVEILGDQMPAEALSELDQDLRDEVFGHLGVEGVVAAISELETDDAIDLIEEMEPHEQREVLEAIPAEDRTFIEEGLTYPEDSAGRLMQRELLAVPEFWTVGETIDYLRRAAEEGHEDELPDTFYDIFVVDPKHRPVGMLPLSKMLRNKRPVFIRDIMSSEHMRLIPVDMDQEEVAFLFRQRDLVSAPVVDDGGRLIGEITIDDVVDVIHEEHEEDIMRMGGLVDDDLYRATMDTTKSRFRWLLVNLFTAVVASLVIGMFEGPLDQIVALAILMPIVASMGGNAGTQTLTVAVRALATKQLSATNAGRVIMKESLVGGLNGILFAILTGIVAWIWFGDPMLGAVIGVAMVVNLLVAGLAGAAIPVALEKFGADPAVASTVFLTTVTDVVGFAAFLGLAALVLL